MQPPCQNLTLYLLGTTGIGKATVLALAAHNPAHVYFTGRNKDKADSVLSELQASSPTVQATFLACDLGSLASIRDAVAKFTSDRLDIFVGNAGIANESPAVTKDGYELQFGVNHVGHAALLKLLLPKMVHAAEQAPAGSVRIVLVSSEGFGLHPKGGIVFDKLKTTCADIGGPMGTGWTCYGQSKLANILYAAELARRYPTIVSTSIHPGVVGTELYDKLNIAIKALSWIANWGHILTPAEGARNQLWAATAGKAEVKNGAYYEPTAILGKGDKDSNSEELAAKLWEWTEKELETF
jgi:NAD(P)-dependent dehydrogenase (short-subunit alcohol dehydrogenase family)